MYFWIKERLVRSFVFIRFSRMDSLFSLDSFIFYCLHLINPPLNGNDFPFSFMIRRIAMDSRNAILSNTALLLYFLLQFSFLFQFLKSTRSLNTPFFSKLRYQCLFIITTPILYFVFSLLYSIWRGTWSCLIYSFFTESLLFFLSLPIFIHSIASSSPTPDTAAAAAAATANNNGDGFSVSTHLTSSLLANDVNNLSTRSHSNYSPVECDHLLSHRNSHLLPVAVHTAPTDIHLFTYSFNCGSKYLSLIDLRNLIPEGKDVYLFALQECKSPAKSIQAINDFLNSTTSNYIIHEQSIGSSFTWLGYHGTITMIVAVKAHLVSPLSFACCPSLGMGLNIRVCRLGNKGSVGIWLRFAHHSLFFVSNHFASDLNVGCNGNKFDNDGGSGDGWLLPE